MNKQDEKAEAARLRGEEPKGGPGKPDRFYAWFALLMIGAFWGGWESGHWVNIVHHEKVHLQDKIIAEFLDGTRSATTIPHTPEPTDSQMTATMHLLVTQEARIASLEAIPDHTATLESHAAHLRLLGNAMLNHGWIVQDGDQLRLVPVQEGGATNEK